MAKRTRQTKKVARPKHKTIGYYIQMYTIASVAGIAAFLIGSFFLKPTIPCANSHTCQATYKTHVDNNATGTFLGQTVVPPKIDLAYEPATSVLGTNDPSGKKHIYIDLSAQRLHAYEESKEIMQALVSTGKWNPTPTGDFNIWLKLRATRMSGGSGADYYNLPNVPYTMFYYGDYGIHGAYWHNNFGHKMSHGCTNMRIVDARELFNWAETGTPVSVCDSFIGPNTCVQKNPVN